MVLFLASSFSSAWSVEPRLPVSPADRVPVPACLLRAPRCRFLSLASPYFPPLSLRGVECTAVPDRLLTDGGSYPPSDGRRYSFRTKLHRLSKNPSSSPSSPASPFASFAPQEASPAVSLLWSSQSRTPVWLSLRYDVLLLVPDRSPSSLAVFSGLHRPVACPRNAECSRFAIFSSLGVSSTSAPLLPRAWLPASAGAETLHPQPRVSESSQPLPLDTRCVRRRSLLIIPSSVKSGGVWAAVNAHRASPWDRCGKSADEGGAGTPGAPELKTGFAPSRKLALPLATAKLRPPQATEGASHPRRPRMLRLPRRVKHKSTKYWGGPTTGPQSVVGRTIPQGTAPSASSLSPEVR